MKHAKQVIKNTKKFSRNIFSKALRLACGISLIAVLVPLSSVSATRTRATYRYFQLDKNGDAVISKSEWSGKMSDFQKEDWNKDGVLSGEELKIPVSGPRPSPYPVEHGHSQSLWDEFQRLDKNRDGYLSRYEWKGSAQQFSKKDKNRDTVLSWEEFSSYHEARNAVFDKLDKNHDGWISRAEWKYSQKIFENLDKNRDGFLSPSEFPENFMPDDAVYLDAFDRLDLNRDGYISQAEWKKKWKGFLSLDQNQDGNLSRSEFSMDFDNDGDYDWDDEWLELDTDRNGAVFASEWKASKGLFQSFDKNNNGKIEKKEFKRQSKGLVKGTAK